MFDPRPDSLRPDRGILAALTAAAAPPPSLSIVVRTDRLDAVKAEIARSQALRRELEVALRRVDPAKVFAQVEHERAEAVRLGIVSVNTAYPSSNIAIFDGGYAEPVAP